MQSCAPPIHFLLCICSWTKGFFQYAACATIFCYPSHNLFHISTICIGRWWKLIKIVNGFQNVWNFKRGEELLWRGRCQQFLSGRYQNKHKLVPSLKQVQRSCFIWPRWKLLPEVTCTTGKQCDIVGIVKSRQLPLCRHIADVIHASLSVDGETFWISSSRSHCGGGEVFASSTSRMNLSAISSACRMS